MINAFQGWESVSTPADTAKLKALSECMLLLAAWL
jgi:hypothetical protein